MPSAQKQPESKRQPETPFQAACRQPQSKENPWQQFLSPAQPVFSAAMPCASCWRRAIRCTVSGAMRPRRRNWSSNAASKCIWAICPMPMPFPTHWRARITASTRARCRACGDAGTIFTAPMCWARKTYFQAASNTASGGWCLFPRPAFTPRRASSSISAKKTRRPTTGSTTTSAAKSWLSAQYARAAYRA